MSEWRTVEVGQVADVFDGPHATPTKTITGPWFLSISSLSSGRLDLAESAHLSEADFTKWTRRATPRPGDVLFSYETRLGEAAIMPEGIRACLGRRMGLLRPKHDLVDPRFLLYSYLSPQFQEQIRQRAIHGATVDRIPLTDLARWELQLPPRPTQNAIGTLLGSLDDKIAVNKRMCSTYEDILRLRFAELGVDTDPVPDREVPVSELMEMNPHTPPPKVDKAVYLEMAVLPTHSARVTGWSRRQPRSGTRFRNGDTVMARITPCLENGKVAFIDFMEEAEVGIGSTEFIVLRTRPDIPMHMSYFLARSPRFQAHAVQNMSGSSGRQRVGAAALAQFVVNRPDPRSLQSFGKAAEPAFAHMKALDAESSRLAELRDMLLPGLMSGVIRVREAETIVSDAS